MEVLYSREVYDSKMSMLINEKNFEKYNAVILSLYLFQYSFLIPLMEHIQPSVIVGVFSSLLMVISLVLNFGKIKIQKNMSLIFFLVLFIFILKAFLDGSEISIIFYYLAFAIPAFLFLSCDIEYSVFFRCANILAMVSFAVIFGIPLLGRYEYMRFGYGMSTIVVFMIARLFLYDKTWSYGEIVESFLAIIGFVELALFGARGSILPVLFFCCGLLIFKIRNSLKCYVYAILGSTIIGYISFHLQEIIIEVVEFFNFHGFSTYSLSKFLMYAKYGFERASSGRTDIYYVAWEKFLSSPFLGNPMLSGEDGTYVHNLFLQFIVDFGVIGIFACLFIFSATFKEFIESDSRFLRVFLLSIFSLAFGRLLFSSSYLLRPEFWVWIFFICSDKLGRCEIE